MRDVLSGKRILLLKSIARDLNWPDMAFFDELLEGFKLVGLQPPFRSVPIGAQACGF